MTELLTAAQMRAIEQAAIESGEVTGLELMERAGRGVVEAIFEEWPELAKTDHRAVVLCGPGNNGGDGFVVARLLREWGWEVEVFLYGDMEKLPPDAKVNCERWLEIGRVYSFGKAKDKVLRAEDDRCLLIVDTLFGTGLKKGLHKEVRSALEAAAIISKNKYTVSVDVPSGICSDSGFVLKDETSAQLDYIIDSEKKLSHTGEVFFSHLTVQIGWQKPYVYLGDGSKFSLVNRVAKLESGENSCLWRKSIELYDKSLLISTVHRAISVLKSEADIDHNKYSHGHALILSGPSTKTGAARLAARGALRIGVGLVTVGAPKDALAEHAAQLNAVMLAEVNGVKNFDDMVLADERVNAICVGPALGLAKNHAKLLEAVLKAKRATVVDADALTLISQDKGLFDLLHGKCVLTPHGGEFARVFPDIAEKLNTTPTKGPAYSKVDAAREAAKRAGCVVLFKGPDTVIAAPDGRCAINSAHYERAAPWLATAGSGDVLAGFITGLLARGFNPMQAAETAAWLHVECALSFGPGLIAEDLSEQLPEVFLNLGL